MPFRNPFQPPRFVDDAFEEPPHGRVVERPRIDGLDVLQYLGLPGRLVHRQAGGLLYAADLQRTGRARVQQPDQLFIERVDLLAQIRRPRR